MESAVDVIQATRMGKFIWRHGMWNQFLAENAAGKLATYEACSMRSYSVCIHIFTSSCQLLRNFAWRLSLIRRRRAFTCSLPISVVDSPLY
jgi:hypothetical protein